MILNRDIESITHRFTIQEYKGCLIVVLDEVGKPEGVSIHIGKHGSTLNGLLKAISSLITLLLQSGVPLPNILDTFREMRFEPMGSTSSKKIPEASSILDYVSKYLEYKFPPS